uniref:Uncharacterized protein n=1 Tax=Heterorhabditis bacteriophora TaxID=37862 RepID=A0A1I7XML0_HETBA
MMSDVPSEVSVAPTEQVKIINCSIICLILFLILGDRCINYFDFEFIGRTSSCYYAIDSSSCSVGPCSTSSSSSKCGLGALAKERPENPIEFLANFLLKEKDRYQPATDSVQ